LIVKVEDFDEEVTNKDAALVAKRHLKDFGKSTRDARVYEGVDRFERISSQLGRVRDLQASIWI